MKIAIIQPYCLLSIGHIQLINIIDEFVICGETNVTLKLI